MRNNLKDVDRPLQKSMIIQQPYSRNQEYTHFNPLKRSSIAYYDSSQQSQNTGNNNHLTMNGNIPLKQYYDRPLTNYPVSSLSQRGLNQLSQSSSNQPPNVLSISEKVDRLMVQMSKHEMMLYDHEKLLKDSKEYDYESNKHVLQDIVHQIKQQHLPQMISKNNNELYQYVFNFKIDIQTLKQELNNSVSKLTQQNLESENYIKEFSESIMKKILQDKSFKKDRKNDIKNYCSVFEEQIQELKKIVHKKDENWKSLLAEKQNKVLKSSIIRSQMTPIMLKYVQSFSLFTNTLNPTIDNNTQIVITTGLYYIDAEGHLMDNQNRYLIDEKGLQVKLGHKHIQVLRKHKILT